MGRIGDFICKLFRNDFIEDKQELTYVENMSILITAIHQVQDSVGRFAGCRKEKDDLWDDYLRKISVGSVSPIVDMLYYQEAKVADVCVVALQLANFAIAKLQEHGLDGQLKPLNVKGWYVDFIKDRNSTNV